MRTDILQEQIQYYRDRAAEYDEWFFRQGRYDRGEDHRRQWFAEISIVQEALRLALSGGDVLELACGTGLWTQHLASVATHLTAVDASPEVMLQNQQRVGSAAVEYIVADLFTWTPKQTFDFVFFSFWLSHVPMIEFLSFWQKVKKSVRPNGRIFFVDSLFNQDSTARNHQTLHHQGYSERQLNNGRTYRVVKIFHDPNQLQISLQNLGWCGQIDRTDNYFLYGLFQPLITPQ